VTSRAAAVVLAAGAASRFGAPKQVLLLPRVLERLAPLREDGTLSDVVVVEGAHALPPGIRSSARVVACATWADGPGSSLRAGLAALASDVEAAVVVLADGPDLSPDAVRRVLTALRPGEGDVVAASYGGVRGHPLVVARSAWKSIPDEGLRAVRPRLVPCDDLGDPGDVDTRADLPPDLA
jgi:nicotine blue oxidoreductase